MFYPAAPLTVDVAGMWVDGDAGVAAAVLDVEVCAHVVLMVRWTCVVGVVRKEEDGEWKVI
jgi:ketosteroid isomerase-like protein